MQKDQPLALVHDERSMTFQISGLDLPKFRNGLFHAKVVQKNPPGRTGARGNSDEPPEGDVGEQIGLGHDGIPGRQAVNHTPGRGPAGGRGGMVVKGNTRSVEPQQKEPGQREGPPLPERGTTDPFDHFSQPMGAPQNR